MASFVRDRGQLNDDAGCMTRGVETGDDLSGPRSRGAWRSYWQRGSLYLAAFIICFNATSWIAAWRGVSFALYLPEELSIPFSPGWIWPYASMFIVIALPPLFLGETQLKRLGQQCLAVLAVASACFVLVPAELGFVRKVPVATPYAQIFGCLFAVDRPNNLVPSLHVAVSTLCLLAFAQATTSWTGRFALWAWLAAIVAATVLVHQHHLLDVASGLALAFVVRRSFFWKLFAWPSLLYRQSIRQQLFKIGDGRREAGLQGDGRRPAE